MDPTPPAPHRPSIAPVFVTIVIDLLGFGMILPLLPLYARDYGASRPMVGLILASFSAMQFLVAPLWGRLSDRIGRRPIIRIGLTGSVLSYLLFASAELFPDTQTRVMILLASRIAAGVFGGTITAALGYIADVTSREERGRGMALVGAAFGVGFLIGPSLGGVGHQLLGPLAPGLIAAALSAGAFVFATLRLEEPARHTQEAHRGDRLRTLRRSLTRPGIRVILSMTFLTVFPFGILESTLALLALERFPGWTPEKNGWLFSYFGLWLALSQGWLVRRLMRHFHEARLVAAGCTGLGAGLLAIAYVRQPLVLAALVPVAVCGSAMIMPSLISLLSKRADPEAQGEILGANESARSLGRIASHGAGPSLLALGTRVPFWIGVAVIGGALLVSFRLRADPPDLSG